MSMQHMHVTQQINQYIINQQYMFIYIYRDIIYIYIQYSHLGVDKTQTFQYPLTQMEIPRYIPLKVPYSICFGMMSLSLYIYIYTIIMIVKIIIVIIYICVYVCECRKAQEYGKAGKLESPWGKHYRVKFLRVTVEYTWHLHVIKNRYHLYIPCQSIWCFVVVYIYISHMCLIYTYIYNISIILNNFL